jgi:hypothetical protein
MNERSKDFHDRLYHKGEDMINLKNEYKDKKIYLKTLDSVMRKFVKVCEPNSRTCSKCDETTDNIYFNYNYKPFSKIIESFIKTENIENVYDIDCYRLKEYKNIIFYNDKDITQKWINHHNKIDIPIFCKDCNSKKTNIFPNRVSKEYIVNDEFIKDGYQNLNKRANQGEHCKQKKLKTYRLLGQNDCERFRRIHKDDVCEFCDSGKNLQVDHYPSLLELVEMFLKENKYYFHDVVLYRRKIKHGNYFGGKLLVHEDTNITGVWKKFHNDNANFRMLCRDCNLSSSVYNFDPELIKAYRKEVDYVFTLR